MFADQIAPGFACPNHAVADVGLRSPLDTILSYLFVMALSKQSHLSMLSLTEAWVET